MSESKKPREPKKPRQIPDPEVPDGKPPKIIASTDNGQMAVDNREMPGDNQISTPTMTDTSPDLH